MELLDGLNQLKLHYTAENLNRLMAESTAGGHSIEQVLQRLIELELVEKKRRGIERRMNKARIGNYKPLQDFDWKWPKSIDRVQVEEAMKCDFIDHHENIIIAGPQGLGKTMIGRNLAFMAVQMGYTAFVISASKLVINLGAQDSKQALERRLRFYEQPDLLVIDEIGYMAFENRSADFIFEIVNRRYEKGSIVITTNLAFSDWTKVFPGAPCTTAMIDRLTHHAKILKIDGDSWRLHESSLRTKH